MRNKMVFFFFLLILSCNISNLKEQEAIGICKQSNIQFKIDDLGTAIAFSSMGLDFGSTWADFANSLAKESPNTKYSWKARRENQEGGIFIVSFEDENGWGHRWEVSIDQKIVKHINSSEFLKRKYLTTRLSDSNEFVISAAKLDTIRIYRRNRYAEPEIVYEYHGTLLNKSEKNIINANISGELKLIFEEKTISGKSGSNSGFTTNPSKNNPWKSGEEREFKIRTRGIELIFGDYIPPFVYFEINLVAEDPVGYMFDRNIKETDIQEKWIQFVDSRGSSERSNPMSTERPNIPTPEPRRINNEPTAQEDLSAIRPTVDPRALFPGADQRSTTNISKNISDQPIEFNRSNGNNFEENINQDQGMGGYSLSGRMVIDLPVPAYNIDAQGRVVVTVIVDREGNVKKAEAGARGTTTTDPRLWRLAEDAALRARFNEKLDAPEEQTGTITYNFIRY